MYPMGGVDFILQFHISFTSKFMQINSGSTTQISQKTPAIRITGRKKEVVGLDLPFKMWFEIRAWFLWGKEFWLSFCFNISTQLAVYTAYIPGINCLLGDYIIPTTRRIHSDWLKRLNRRTRQFGRKFLRLLFCERPKSAMIYPTLQGGRWSRPNILR